MSNIVESELSQNIPNRVRSSETDNKEVAALKKRLAKKEKEINLLKSRYEKLERSSDIQREFNNQWQQRFHSCTCDTFRKEVISIVFLSELL